MSATVLLGVMIGSLLGGVIGYFKARNALVGVLLGACIGTVAGCLIGRGPRTVIAVDTPDQFRREVLEADEPVLVDFYADWCPPCRRLAPVLKDLAAEYAGRARFVKVDVDVGGSLARQFGVRGIPTVILFVRGKPVQSLSGCRPADHYRHMLEKVL